MKFLVLKAALFSITLATFASLSSLNAVAWQKLAADDPAPTEVGSDDATNDKVSEQIRVMRGQFADSGKVSEENRTELAGTLSAQYDSFVANLKENSDGDSLSELRMENLVEQRDSFVEQRLRLLCREIEGEEIPGMEFQAFFDACTRLGLRVNLSNGLVNGAPVAATRIVVLSLPKMDCPGCASVVRDKLGGIDGVFESATSVELGNCRVLLSADLELDDHLDELAKTVVQFEEWSKE